jgi:hypothetical protein
MAAGTLCGRGGQLLQGATDGVAVLIGSAIAAAFKMPFNAELFRVGFADVRGLRPFSQVSTGLVLRRASSSRQRGPPNTKGTALALSSL